jgi:hypothetical protein
MQQKNTSHFSGCEIMEKSDLEVELIMSSLYFFFYDRVFKGLDTKKRQNWVGIFQKNNLMSTSLLQDPNLINKQPEDLPGQYYLKRILQSYHNIAAAGIQLSFPKNQITTTQRYSDVILQKTSVYHRRFNNRL